MTNEGPIAGYLGQGLGKTASAYFIQLADSKYLDQNIRFFYVDERQAKRMPIFTGLGGQANADIFLGLAEDSGCDQQ